ncbi:MAG: methyl-accepting chemotaxis protein [Burkholderiales bacterium]
MPTSSFTPHQVRTAGRLSLSWRMGLGLVLTAALLMAVAGIWVVALNSTQAQLQRLVSQTDQGLLEGLPKDAAGQRIAEQLTKRNAAVVAQAQAEQARFLWIGGGALLLVIAVGGLAAWAFVKSIRDPIDRAADLAERIAEGDLTAEADLGGDDELGRLQRAVSQMQDRLRLMVGNIRETTDSISTASTQIAAGNADLSNRTEQTAGSLQHTASSMEQLTGTVRDTALSARTANELVATAVRAAQRGGEVVSQVVANMEEISASSRRIGEIIAVIDGIAFQTNILALNAAVEAARAGEQGRGFAVVAGEVRNLAQRAANAAKEIKTLVNASVEKVESGGQLVRDAGMTMEQIVSSVQSVTEIIGKISTTTGEQSEGLQQVSVSVQQLDTMTQRNAALVNESASAAESLRTQADRLQKVVGAFKLLQQTQEAAWTAHTAISSARHKAKGVGGGEAPLAAAARQTLNRPPAPGKPNRDPKQGPDDWENF